MRFYVVITHISLQNTLFKHFLINTFFSHLMHVYAIIIHVSKFT